MFSTGLGTITAQECYADGFGNVTINVLLADLSTWSGEKIIGQIPKQYAPSKTLRFSSPSTGAAANYVYISSDGRIGGTHTLGTGKIIDAHYKL